MRARPRWEPAIRRSCSTSGFRTMMGSTFFARCDGAGKPQFFAAREIVILELLMRRSGRVVPRKLVEDHLFGIANDIGSNAIEVYIHRIRKQLAETGADAQIHTVRGVGYMIVEAR